MRMPALAMWPPETDPPPSPPDPLLHVDPSTSIYIYKYRMELDNCRVVSDNGDTSISLAFQTAPFDAFEMSSASEGS